MVRSISLLLASAGLASCIHGQPVPDGAPVGSQVRAAQSILAGKAPMPQVSCLPRSYGNTMTVVDGRTLLFHLGSESGPRPVYVAFLSPGCEMVGRTNYALVARESGGSMCRGDIEQLVDTASHAAVGGCSVTAIVPYKTR
jgi:hypothetical protein